MAGHLSLTFSNSLGIENVIGSGWADSIEGNARANLLQGMGGNDKHERLQLAGRRVTVRHLLDGAIHLLHAKRA